MNFGMSGVGAAGGSKTRSFANGTFSGSGVTEAQYDQPMNFDSVYLRGSSSDFAELNPNGGANLLLPKGLFVFSIKYLWFHNPTEIGFRGIGIGTEIPESLETSSWSAVSYLGGDLSTTFSFESHYDACPVWFAKHQRYAPSVFASYGKFSVWSLE